MAGQRGGVRVDGVDRTRRAFRRAADRAEALGELDTEAARIVEADAQRRVPVASGRLRATIHVEARDDTAVVVAGGPLVPYAGVIQHGWAARGIEAQPYLDDRRRDDVVEVYRDGAQDIVRAFDREAP